MEAIRKMSYEELRDAEKRNQKLLSNRLFLEKLPDKGKKLLETHEKILERLKKCEEERELANLFSGMKVDVDKMEWAGGIAPEAGAIQTGDQSQPVPKEEDERDIVNILCTTNQLEKIVIDERKSASSNHNHNKDKFYKHLMDKVDHLNHVDHKYKPFKSLKHEKTLKTTLPPKWENTAATPPKFSHPNGGVVIPIVDSLDCLMKTEEKVRDYEIQKSSAHFQSDSVRQSSVSFSPDASAINPEEDEQVYDDDEQNGGGLVINIPWPEDPTVPQ